MTGFAHWYENAGVRGGPRRRYAEETAAGKVFFPERLVPHAAHEAVRAADPETRKALSVRHLYQFLLSTAHLETRVVNRTAELVANGRSGLDLPMSMRLDAFKVYCDEGYHSLYSLDLADQIATATGIPIPDWDYGGYVDRLAAAGEALLPGAPKLVPLLQVIVFETLVTAVLNEIPNDATVVSAVREITRDHARDEGHHHRYFAALFHELWRQVDPGLRRPVALALPGLIRACLTWDTAPVRDSLALAGLPADDIVKDCYAGDAGADRIADVCRATVRVYQSAGVFEVPGAAEAFAAHGLLPQAGA